MRLRSDEWSDQDTLFQSVLNHSPPLQGDKTAPFTAVTHVALAIFISIFMSFQTFCLIDVRAITMECYMKLKKLWEATDLRHSVAEILFTQYSIQTYTRAAWCTFANFSEQVFSSDVTRIKMVKIMPSLSWPSSCKKRFLIVYLPG